MITLKQILVPSDFSEASEAAVKYGRAFAQQFAASLHVLHVMEDPFIYAPTSEGYVVPPHFYEEIEHGAQDRLNKVLTDAEREKFRAQLVIKKGSPFVEIIRYAREQDIDLI